MLCPSQPGVKVVSAVAGGRLAEAGGRPKLPALPESESFWGCAEVAQLVERNLAKVEVAGSSPVFRSHPAWFGWLMAGAGTVCGDVAEWLGAGLQNPSLRFNSGRRLEVGDDADHGWGP
jgi:hypothetical protein